MTTFCGSARQTRLEFWDLAHHPAQAGRVGQGDAASNVGRRRPSVSAVGNPNGRTDPEREIAIPESRRS